MRQKPELLQFVKKKCVLKAELLVLAGQPLYSISKQLSGKKQKRLPAEKPATVHNSFYDMPTAPNARHKAQTAHKKPGVHKESVTARLPPAAAQSFVGDAAPPLQTSGLGTTSSSSLAQHTQSVSDGVTNENSFDGVNSASLRAASGISNQSTHSCESASSNGAAPSKQAAKVRDPLPQESAWSNNNHSHAALNGACETLSSLYNERGNAMNLGQDRQDPSEVSKRDALGSFNSSSHFDANKVASQHDRIISDGTVQTAHLDGNLQHDMVPISLQTPDEPNSAPGHQICEKNLTIDVRGSTTAQRTKFGVEASSVNDDNVTSPFRDGEVINKCNGDERQRPPAQASFDSHADANEIQEGQLRAAELNSNQDERASENLNARNSPDHRIGRQRKDEGNSQDGVQDVPPAVQQRRNRRGNARKRESAKVAAKKRQGSTGDPSPVDQNSRKFDSNVDRKVPQTGEDATPAHSRQQFEEGKPVKVPRLYGFKFRV